MPNVRPPRPFHRKEARAKSLAFWPKELCRTDTATTKKVRSRLQGFGITGQVPAAGTVKTMFPVKPSRSRSRVSPWHWKCVTCPLKDLRCLVRHQDLGSLVMHKAGSQGRRGYLTKGYPLEMKTPKHYQTGKYRRYT